MTPEITLFILRLLAAASLFAFLGFVAYTLWRDLRTATSAGFEAPRAHLLALDEPHEGARFELEPLTELGRTASNTVCLEHETVSANHARISFQGGQWWLEDLASRNGTQVNQVRVEQPLVITYGDEIGLGMVRLRLQRGPASTGAGSVTVDPG